jgi:hypothetical protein
MKFEALQQHRQIVHGYKNRLLLAAMAIDQLQAVAVDRLVHGPQEAH